MWKCRINPIKFSVTCSPNQKHRIPCVDQKFESILGCTADTSDQLSDPKCYAKLYPLLFHANLSVLMVDVLVDQ